MTVPAPSLDSFKRGEVARDVKMLAAAGALATPASEQMAMLVLLVDDPDSEVRSLAEATLNRIPVEALKGFLAQENTPAEVRDFFVRRGVIPPEIPAVEAGAETSPIDTEPSEALDDLLDDTLDGTAEGAEARRESISQRLSKMGFTQKLKAAAKGNKEIRSILIRDPSKMIAAAVLSSPKVTDAEVAGFARMGNVSEDVLRTIGSNRAWLKNYSVVAALIKNPKTPVAMSMNFLARLSDRDAAMLATDRNIPEALRAAARKRATAAREK